MKVKILGTAAYERVPAMFCNCPACRAALKEGGKSVRTQAQAILDGCVLTDFGGDNYMHFLNSGEDFSAMRALIITHAHSDHFNKEDLIMRGEPYAHAVTAPKLFICASSECINAIPESAKDIIPAVIKPYDSVRFEKYTFTALPAIHSTAEPLVYIISDGEKTLFYSLDTGLLQDEAYDFIKKRGFVFDAVISDCTYGLMDMENCHGHMSLKDNLTHRKRLSECGALKDGAPWVITHFSHNGLVVNGRGVTHDELEKIASRHGMIVAFDGMEIEF